MLKVYSAVFSMLQTSVNHSALESQKILFSGLHSGSSSKVPAEMITYFSLRENQGIDEPQVGQKPVQKYFALSGLKRFTKSPPLVH